MAIRGSSLTSSALDPTGQSENHAPRGSGKSAGIVPITKLIKPDQDVATAQLDATGLICPLPVLRARKALKDLPAGGLLEVRATDPAAPKDMIAFCEATGHTLVESSEADGVYRFLLRKGGSGNGVV